jgi:hypothetical protein
MEDYEESCILYTFQQYSRRKKQKENKREDVELSLAILLKSV